MASVKTNKYREKQAKAMAGTGTLPRLVKIQLGTGGTDVNGTPKQLTGTETALFNKVLEKMAVVSFPAPTTCRLTISVDADADGLLGRNINEAAIVDADGELAAIKTFTNKGMESGVVFDFDYDAEC
ncbi:hypothetical protein [Brevibacillus fulvus]|uniref:Phage tail protein n=1 Tax=Brevibacillus fulvus TaxID=1125967 RepID=A0A938Y0P9_9BACL|nr:hypothetical protein [Brevibacillus fulvus]MBM7591185.1 hypothetical protein [Brevibacillus fulvus]